MLLRTALAAYLVALACIPVNLHAEDFRIESKVYQANETEPAYTNLTLFHSGLVYDFLGEPATEVTIYDSRRGHFMLLDVERQCKTRINRDVLLLFVNGIAGRAAANDRGDAILREAANPNFKIQADDGQRRLTLTGDRIHYTVDSEASFPSDEAARAYSEFADMYARLNSTRPGELPPQARLQLNAELAQRGWMPIKVEKIERRGRRLFGRTEKAHSEHEVAWQLLEGDQRRMDTADRQLSDFKSVTFAEYRKLGVGE